MMGILRENRSHERYRPIPSPDSSIPDALIARAYAGGRVTAPRRAVACAAERAGGAFTVDDLVALARAEDPGVSTATVYRCVAAMVASGHLAPVGERRGAALWVRCDAGGHHHHLVCTSCGATTHTACPLDTRAIAAAAPEGFTVTSHDVRLYGLCASCARTPRTTPGEG